MDDSIFQSAEYQQIAISTIEQTIRFLFDKDQEFSLACETEYLTFNPELPLHIKETFGETVLFILSGYTYETAQLEDDSFRFEAGFGEESFGSVVTLPLLAIKQIFVEEYPVVINMSSPQESIKEVAEEEEFDASISMSALLNNPENQKFLKKK